MLNLSQAESQLWERQLWAGVLADTTEPLSPLVLEAALPVKLQSREMLRIPTYYANVTKGTLACTSSGPWQSSSEETFAYSLLRSPLQLVWERATMFLGWLTSALLLLSSWVRCQVPPLYLCLAYFFIFVFFTLHHHSLIDLQIEFNGQTGTDLIYLGSPNPLGIHWLWLNRQINCEFSF